MDNKMCSPRNQIDDIENADKKMKKINKSNFRQGVHRNFKGLIDPLKVNGIIDQIGSHRIHRSPPISNNQNARRRTKKGRSNWRPIKGGEEVLVLMSSRKKIMPEEEL